MTISSNKYQLIKQLYLKGVNQRDIAKQANVSPTTVNTKLKQIIEELKLEKKKIDIAHNEIRPYVNTVEVIQQRVMDFVDKIFSQKDFTKIPPEIMIQAQVKLIEILNKDK